MKRSAQDVLLMVFGAILLQIGLTDLHLRFVKPSMQPLIVASAVVLLAVSAGGLGAQVRAGSRARSGTAAGRPGRDEHEVQAHEHGAPRTSWLLALPLLVLVLVAPPALGADAVGRGAGPPPVAPDARYPPLPGPRDGTVDLSLGDYTGRALFEPKTLQGAPLRLLGFAVPDAQGWVLGRVVLSCCAADGRAVTVRMTGDSARVAPRADSWWEVTGTYAPPLAGDGRVPALRVISLTAVAAPREPYASSSRSSPRSSGAGPQAPR